MLPLNVQLTQDEISLVVVKGTNHATTPVDPTIVQQNLLTGGTERLVALWRVVLDGINDQHFNAVVYSAKKLECV